MVVPVGSDVKAHAKGWKEKTDFIHRLLSLLSSYQSYGVRHAAFGSTFPCPQLTQVLLYSVRVADVLRGMVLTYQSDALHIIAPILVQYHANFQEHSVHGEH